MTAADKAVNYLGMLLDGADHHHLLLRAGAAYHDDDDDDDDAALLDPDDAAAVMLDEDLPWDSDVAALPQHYEDLDSADAHGKHGGRPGDGSAV